jgi:uncharacterized repeat protein (TIGR03803 family)
MKPVLTLFAIALLVTVSSASTFKVFYTFSGKDGSFPNGDLLADSAGNLYGTAQFGGSSVYGVVFKLSPTGKETILYNFTGKADGGIPIGRVMMDKSGNLYGMTSLGGDATCSCGTVYKLAPNGTLTVLHAFKGGKDGAQNQAQPELGLVSIDGNFYGSASFGGDIGCDGNLGCGVVFKVSSAGKEKVLYRFDGKTNGAFPQDVISDDAGNLYSTTGGSYISGNGGTIFKIDSAGKLTTLYTFTGTPTGVSPRWHPLRTNSGTFLGATQFGGSTTNCVAGSAGCGVVYSVNASGKERVLHAFYKNPNDGAEPSGGLLKAGSNLYGVTVYGGTINSNCTFGCGVVYRASTTGRYLVLYRFTGGADGNYPSGSLAQDSAGNLYGATSAGGNGDGVIFKITP